MRMLSPTKFMNAIDRQEIEQKIRQSMGDCNCSLVIAADSGNFTYTTGLVLPFSDQYPEDRAAAIFPSNPEGVNAVICPVEWRDLVERQGWQGKVVTYGVQDGLYPIGLIGSLARFISEAGLEKASIGFDLEQTNLALIDRLRQALPDARWVSFGERWKSLRMIKTDAEARMLEEAARQADRAVVSALNHMEGCALDTLGYSLWEFTERIRVHVGEFAGSATGHVATLQGADLGIYSKAPVGNFIMGNPVRAEVTNHHYGYWGSGARTFFVGKLSPEFAQAYRENIQLKQAALKLMQPGVSCSQVYNETVWEANRAGIDLWRDVGIGYGVGANEREAPYLSPQDATILQPGMVIVLAVYTCGPNQEMICSKDTYQIIEGGHRLLSWYRNWDTDIYRVFGNTARHG